MGQKAQEFMPLRILHLEDSPQDAEIIRELLIDAGIDLSIDSADTEKKFVSLLRSRKYDIILADFKLPGFDAFGALRWSTKICPEVPFICVSGTIGEESAVELIRLGADDYILKDRLKRLPFAIKRALDEAKEKETRKQIEEALRESENRLRQIAERSRTFIWEVDAEGLYSYASHESRAVVGYRPEEIVGKKHFYDLHPDFGREAFKAAVFEFFARKDSIINLENPIQTKTGQLVWVLTNGIPILDTDGKFLGYRGSDIDITKRKLAEEKIQNNLKEKEVLIKELYHRTKNNMQIISSMLRLKAHSVKEQKLSDAFKDIENKILSMALVHQKLFESKDLSHLDLKDYLSSLISLVKQSYLELMSKITIRPNMESIHVLIDTAVPVGLIVNELLTNAVKHGFPNARRGEILVNLHLTQGNALVLEISDNGVGLPKIFDFKNDIYLGLQTVIDLVEHQLGGKIKFTSRNGLHCRMTFSKELYQPRV